MLKILFNGIEQDSLGYNIKWDAPDWFDGNYYDEWLDDEFVKQMVLDIDKSVLSGHNVVSPVLGSISVLDLSGGVKTCICLYKEEEDTNMIFRVQHCGDNCAPIIEEIGKRKDVTIALPYLMKFSENIKAICLNDGSMINNSDDYYRSYCKNLRDINK